MSNTICWYFNTESDAREAFEKYRNDPYRSLGMPVQLSNGQWFINVSIYNCD